MSCRIVLLHETPVATQPIQSAFAERWPEAEIVNLLDDGLSLDRAREPELTEAMIERFVAFGPYGYRMGADGILVTCSAFGPACQPTSLRMTAVRAMATSDRARAPASLPRSARRSAAPPPRAASPDAK